MRRGPGRFRQAQRDVHEDEVRPGVEGPWNPNLAGGRTVSACGCVCAVRERVCRVRARVLCVSVCERVCRV